MRFTLNVVPMGKPRMTQRDKWQKRDCVVRYRAYADTIRLQMPKNIPSGGVLLNWIAFLPIPKSRRKEGLAGKLHDEKPDADNIDKGLSDILFEQDKSIPGGVKLKFWDDGKGPRVIVYLSGFDSVDSHLFRCFIDLVKGSSVQERLQNGTFFTK